VFTVSEGWRTTYPGAAVGILAMHEVANPKHDTAFDKRKEELESQLRSRFSGHDRAALKALPIFRRWQRWWKPCSWPN
jgi:hypothetical protein